MELEGLASNETPSKPWFPEQDKQMLIKPDDPPRIQDLEAIFHQPKTEKHLHDAVPRLQPFKQSQRIFAIRTLPVLTAAVESNVKRRTPIVSSSQSNYANDEG